MENWTEFVDVANKSLITQRFARRYGVYQVRAVTTSGKSMPIGRLLKRDKSGLVYVGRSSRESIAVRVGKNTTNLKAYKAVEEKLPRTRLQARAKFLSKDEAKKVERQLLEDYRREYGELPPFNSKLG